MNIQKIQLTDEQNRFLNDTIRLMYNANYMDGRWADQGCWLSLPEGGKYAVGYAGSGPYGFLHEAARMALVLVCREAGLTEELCDQIADDTMILNSEFIERSIQGLLDTAIAQINARD